MSFLELFSSSHALSFLHVSSSSTSLTSAHLSVNVNWIRGRPINLELRLSILRDLPDERHRLTQVIVFVRHLHIEEADRLLGCCTDGASLLELFAVRLKILVVVTRRIKILECKKEVIIGYLDAIESNKLSTNDSRRERAEKIFTFRSMTMGFVMSGSNWRRLDRSQS